LELDAPVLLRQHLAIVNAPEKQLSLAREVSVAGGAAKTQILSV
jgi:hypothetical protein